MRLTRRAFIGTLFALGGGGRLAFGARQSPPVYDDWRNLLPLYTAATRRNIVTVDGRRALLSSRNYPGTYVRDAVFWGPLALDDPALGCECYTWFAEQPLASGQIRTAIPLAPEDVDRLQPQDDEGTLLFVIASDWLAARGCALDRTTVERAYAWTQTQVEDERYISQAGAFRYWADTVQPDVPEAITHNLGLHALARRAAFNLGIDGVDADAVARAQSAYRDAYDAAAGYLPLGRWSRFATAQDQSAVFPEFLSRYLYDEPILSDAMVLAHVERALATALVPYADGRIAGIKIICAAYGEFLPPDWFFAPGLNAPGDYQNGGYWSLYSLVALALAYRISTDDRYAGLIATLVENELAGDGRSKEIIRLTPGAVGTYDPARSDYTWNALIRAAVAWAGLT